MSLRTLCTMIYFTKLCCCFLDSLKAKKLQLNKVIYSLFASQIQTHPDPFLRSIAHWVLEDYSGALDTLLEQPVKNTRSVSTEGDYDADLSEFLMALSKVLLLF